MKNLLFALIFMSSFFFSQEVEILEHYPKGQQFYDGGIEAFYKNFHEVLLSEKIQPCENKNEMYMMKLIVYPDATIKYGIEENTAKIAQNKCTIDTTLKVLGHLNSWKPAEIDGKKYGAVVTIPIYLNDLFDKYKKNYTPDLYFKKPEYKKGIDRFRENITNEINLKGYDIENRFTIIVFFTVDENGETQNVKIENETDNKQFNQMIIEAIKFVSRDWKPATFHNIPIPYNFRMPLTLNQ